MTSSPSEPEIAAEERRAENRHPTALLVGIVALAFIVHELQWILLPFVLSGLLAYVCTPLVEWVTAHIRKPRWVGAVLVFFGILLLLGLAALFAAPPLARELAQAVTGLRELFQGLAKALLGQRTISLFGQSMNAAQLAQTAVSAVRGWIGHPERVAMIGASLAAAIFGSFVGLVLLFYFLLSGPQLMTGALWLAPPERRALLREILRRLDPLLKRYFIGVIITIAYATCAAYIGLGLVLHVNHALILGLVTGVLEILPVFGPAASALLAGIAALHSATGIGLILGYAIYAVALRLSIDQFLAPIALGRAARMHPPVIIFCFFAGGALFGLVGIVLAVPTALAVRVSLCVLRDEPERRPK